MNYAPEGYQEQVVDDIQSQCAGCAFEDDTPSNCYPRKCGPRQREDGRRVRFIKINPVQPPPVTKAHHKVYVIGSLRNEVIPQVAETLRKAGHAAFDAWYSAGPEADDYWQKHEKFKGHTFQQALAGYAAQNVYAFDKRHLDAADVVVMVMPAGKSGHLELGYSVGKGKRTYILMDGEPERYDVMYNFATKVVMSVEELLKELAS